MRRRLVLALIIVTCVGTLSGCFLPMEEGSLDMTSVTDEQLAHRMSRNVSDGTSAADEIARKAIENGSTTTDVASLAVNGDSPFAYRGQYYTFNRTIIGHHEVVAVDVEIDYNASDTNGTAIEYDRLPNIDQQALQSLLPPPADRTEDRMGTVAHYTDENRSKSVLVGNQQYDVVIYDGTRYPLTVEEPQSVTISTFRYTATKAADDSAEYAQQLKRSYLFTLSNLPDDERDITKKAISGHGYMTEDSNDDAFKSLSDRFREHSAITKYDSGGQWLVRYHGTVYLAELDYSGFITTTDSETATADGPPRTHW